MEGSDEEDGSPDKLNFKNENKSTNEQQEFFKTTTGEGNLYGS